MAKTKKQEMQQEDNRVLREALADYLRGAYTHKPLAELVKDFPIKLANERPKGIPYSAWGLLEHIHITQHDMLDFIRNPNYEEMEWPKDYWPAKDAKADRERWRLTIDGYEKDVVALYDIVRDTSIDLFAKIPHSTGGQTVFREVIQAIDHASYHLGEFVVLRRILGAWKKE